MLLSDKIKYHNQTGSRFVTNFSIKAIMVKIQVVSQGIIYSLEVADGC